MKKVLSISLGSSKRDKKINTTILEQDFMIERRGTDGDKKKAAYLFEKLDGKYDAFGLGGIDLYIYARGNRYCFRDARKIIKKVSRTPVVDGSGLKNTLERKILYYLDRNQKINFAGKRVLLVSALDRFGMADTFTELGAEVVFGDLIFGLNLPLPLKSIRALEILLKLAGPIITRLPFEIFYPTGKKQNQLKTSKTYSKYYHRADIIAGDYHFIKKFLPDNIRGKVIITNSVTENDIQRLKDLKVNKLITTTPELKGRSFGTNVMEAVLVALADKPFTDLETEDYYRLLDKLNFKPRILDF